MKVLICTKEYYPYGSGTANRVYNLVLQLRKLGVDCTVCSPTGPDIKLGNFSRIRRFGRLGLLYYWYLVSRYFKRKAEDYDVAWLNYPLFLFMNPFRKSVITVDSTAYGKIIKKIYSLPVHIYYYLSFQIEKYCLHKISKSRAKFVVLTSQQIEELGGIGIDINNITCISNGVDIERFKPLADKKKLREKFNLPDDNIIFLFVGSLFDVKQPYKLIEVFSLVSREVNNCTLVIAGRGKLLRKTKELVKEIGLDDVIFMGYLDYKEELPELYACSDYFIIASKYEGLPLALLEAMASGLPCIVSNITSLKSIVQTAKCGIAVNFNYPKTSARQIINYIEKDNTKYSKNAREYVVTNLTWEKIAKQYLRTFESLKQV